MAVREQLTKIVSFPAPPARRLLLMAPLSRSGHEQVDQLQATLGSRLGAENLWLPQGEQRHITVGFVELVDPSADPEEQGGQLKTVTAKIIPALGNVASRRLPLFSALTTIKPSLEAVIAQSPPTGNDVVPLRLQAQTAIGQFSDCALLTKPSVHTTFVRFQSALPFSEVEAAVSGLAGFREVTTGLVLAETLHHYCDFEPVAAFKTT